MDFRKQCQKLSKMPIAVCAVLACLFAVSCAGCSAGPPAQSGWWPGLRNSARICESCRTNKTLSPTCKAPEAVAVGAPAEPPLPVPTEVPVAATGTGTPEPVEPIAAAQPPQVPAIPIISAIPETSAPVASAPEAFPVAPIVQNPESAASLDDLNRCQNQMAELSTRFSSLEDTHQKSQHALVLLLAEQRRLKLDNERLKRDLELNHQQDIESLDSLSQIIEDVVSAPAAEISEIPGSAGSGSKSAEDVPATPLPAVEAGT